jgi:hypothetical protein
VRKTLDEDNQSFLNIDTSTDEFCIAGLARGIDPGENPNREVTFEYRSQGSIKRESSKRVIGEFIPVDLTLTVMEVGGSTLFQDTITSACQLKGRLLREGEKGRTRLKCKLGDFFSGFGIPQDLLGNIDGAFPKGESPHVKVNTTKGRLTITNNGEPPPSSVEIDVSCSLGG